MLLIWDGRSVLWCELINVPELVVLRSSPGVGRSGGSTELLATCRSPAAGRRRRVRAMLDALRSPLLHSSHGATRRVHAWRHLLSHSLAFVLGAATVVVALTSGAMEPKATGTVGVEAATHAGLFPPTMPLTIPAYPPARLFPAPLANK